MSLELSRRAVLGGAMGSPLLAAVGLMDADPKSGLRLVYPGYLENRPTGLADVDLSAFTAIDRDLVKHWCTRLGLEFAQRKHGLAYLPWIEAKVLAGLVREAGGTSKIDRLDRSLHAVRFAERKTLS